MDIEFFFYILYLSLPLFSGEWQIEVTYDDMDVPSSPLFVNVFDPNLANIIRENGYLAYLNQPYFFQGKTYKKISYTGTLLIAYNKIILFNISIPGQLHLFCFTYNKA